MISTRLLKITLGQDTNARWGIIIFGFLGRIDYPELINRSRDAPSPSTVFQILAIITPMKLFSIYLYGVCLCMGLFNAFAVLFGTPRLVEFTSVVTAGGNLINAALGILGIFINALLAIAYFVMGLVYLRRESAGTLDINEAMVGWLGLLVLFGVNLFGANLIASMLTRLSTGLPVP